MNFLRYLLFTCIGMIAITGVQATHLAGMEMVYEYLSGQTYRIKVNYYRDCAGVPARPSLVLQYTSTACQFSDTISIYPDGTITEISDVCLTAVTTCNGGTATGIQRYVYTIDLTLPFQCADWKIGVADLARNVPITTINNPNNTPMYVETKINNTGTLNNNSPTFTNDPVGFACIGQTFTYNQGAVDVDGDSLVYELVTPQGCNTNGGQISYPIVPNNVSFIAPFTTTNPLPSSTAFTLSPFSGTLNFTPNASAVGILAIRVKEFRNGLLIGTVLRDMQFQTVSCANNSLPAASGVNGTTSYTVNTCLGDSVSFYVNSTDAEQAQVVTMSSNVAQSIPAAIFSISGGNRPTGTFSWYPTSNDIGSNTFTVEVKDNACPTNGVQIFTYTINVASVNVTATALQDDVSTSVSGGTAPYTYLWSNSATTSALTNVAAGTYTVTVTDANGCTGVAVVVVAPVNCEVKFGANYVNPTCGYCNGSITLFVHAGTAPYSYQWSNGKTSKNNQNACSGVYTVTVTDANGCTVTGTFLLTGPQKINVAVAVDSCIATCKGKLTANPSNGVTPYTYLWSTGATTKKITNLCNGTYTVTVTDANGCTRTVKKKVKGCGTQRFGDEDAEGIESDADFAIFPNPSNTAFTVQNFSGKTQQVSVIDVTGKVIYTNQLNEQLIFGNELQQGIYIIRLSDGDKVETYKLIKVN